MSNERNYKSNVFVMLLEEKKRALELYNAVNDSNYDVSKNDNNILENLNNAESNNKIISKRNKKSLKSETNIVNDLYTETIFQKYNSDKHPNEILQRRKNNKSNISENSSMYNSSKSNYENNENVKVIEEEQNNNSNVLGRKVKINLN